MSGATIGKLHNKFNMDNSSGTNRIPLLETKQQTIYPIKDLIKNETSDTRTISSPVASIDPTFATTGKQLYKLMVNNQLMSHFLIANNILKGTRGLKLPQF